VHFDLEPCDALIEYQRVNYHGHSLRLFNSPPPFGQRQEPIWIVEVADWSVRHSRSSVNQYANQLGKGKLITVGGWSGYGPSAGGHMTLLCDIGDRYKRLTDNGDEFIVLPPKIGHPLL